MYVIVVYDIKDDRIRNEVKELLQKFLDHVQKSVFEGHLTSSQIYYIKREIQKLINPETDYVIIYVLPSKGYLKEKIEIGKKREEVEIL